MTDNKMAARLELRWRPVVDERGRTRMEAYWTNASEQVSSPRITHAA